MIRHIEIRNFAIIKEVVLDFHDGLNIITGETGAGKSIVVEAVSLALGSRADTAFIRSGEDKATVQMIADYKGEEYIITRELSSGGRNICRINDSIVTLATLKELCAKLADIHGQYDHQSLLDPESHISLVDTYEKDKILPLKEKVRTLWQEYRDIGDRLAGLRKDLAESNRQRDFMAFELEEIRNAALIPGEEEELQDRISLLRNSENIYSNLSGAYHAATESEGALLDGLKQISTMLADTAPYSNALNRLSMRADELYYEFEDICTEIRRSRDEAVFSPEELDCAIAREEEISRLRKKHGKTVEELLEYADSLEESLSQIDNADEMEAVLQKELEASRDKLYAASIELSNRRKQAASMLEKLISEELHQLNFGDAKFLIDFKSTLDGDSEAFSPEGTDKVEFLISTNKGEPLKPLSKIASGGEMSRIMLAFKKIVGDYDEIPTMIFDEIDSGISGIAASVVGRKLQEISSGHQIICITHLPQIAACGSSNYRISKHTEGDMTFTTVDYLSHEEKISEIARLLGGENITETTMASAGELVASSEAR
ncbi:MAG: DNA repair protein RecN [Lentihominibacter sp.]